MKDLYEALKIVESYGLLKHLARTLPTTKTSHADIKKALNKRQTRLSPSQVREVRKLSRTLTHADVEAQTGVNKGTVGRIYRKQAYTDVK